MYQYVDPLDFLMKLLQRRDALMIVEVIMKIKPIF